jgi:hypothetical protein
LKKEQKIDKIVRKFGLTKDRDGLITRYLNEKLHWASHLQQTKDFISESTNTSSGICMVLGTGWWLDIPVEELDSKFKKLIFVDIAHPAQIIKKAARFPKIQLITMDLTGILSRILECKHFSDDHFFRQLNYDSLSEFVEGYAPDFLVSCNILSQLSYFPKRYVNQRASDPRIAEIIERGIEEAHLKMMNKVKSCLITDYYQYEYDNKDKIIHSIPRIRTELPVEHIKKEWIWDFDLSGNYILGRPVRFKVAALRV